MFKVWLNFRNIYVLYKLNNYINKFFYIFYECLFYIVYLLVMYFKKNYFSNNFEVDKNIVFVKI